MIHEIFVIEEDDDLTSNFKEKFKNTKEVSFKQITPDALGEHLLDIPTLIIINEDKINENLTVKLCHSIRNNEDNSITPIIVITSHNSLEHERKILKEEVQSYIQKPVDDECMFYMINSIIKLLYRNRGVSPLTKLPRKFTYSSRTKETFT